MVPFLIADLFNLDDSLPAESYIASKLVFFTVSGPIKRLSLKLRLGGCISPRPCLLSPG